MSAHEREQAALTAARLVPARDKPGQVGMVFQNPLQSRAEFGHACQQFGLQGLNRKERNQPDERAYFDYDGISVRQAQNVVIEFVFIVPQTDAFTGYVGHRGGYLQKVLEKFCGYVLVDRVVPGQLESDT